MDTIINILCFGQTVTLLLIVFVVDVMNMYVHIYAHAFYLSCELSEIALEIISSPPACRKWDSFQFETTLKSEWNQTYSHIYYGKLAQ